MGTVDGGDDRDASSPSIPYPPPSDTVDPCEGRNGTDGTPAAAATRLAGGVPTRPPQWDLNASIRGRWHRGVRKRTAALALPTRQKRVNSNASGSARYEGDHHRGDGYSRGSHFTILSDVATGGWTG